MSVRDDLNQKAMERVLKVLAEAIIVLPTFVVPSSHLYDSTPIRKVKRLNQTGSVEANENVSGLHLVQLLHVGERSKVNNIQLKMRDLL